MDYYYFNRYTLAKEQLILCNEIVPAEVHIYLIQACRYCLDSIVDQTLQDQRPGWLAGSAP